MFGYSRLGVMERVRVPREGEQVAVLAPRRAKLAKVTVQNLPSHRDIKATAARHHVVYYLLSIPSNLGYTWMDSLRAASP